MMMSLAEELVLLAYADDGTAWGAGTAIDFGVAGAHLIELALAGRIALRDGGIEVADPAPTGFPLADAALTAIAADPKRRTPKDWVKRLSRKARQPVLDRLVEAGVVERVDEKVLLFVPFTRYPATGGVEPAAETARRGLMHAAVTDPDATPDDRTRALCALVDATDWHRRAFPDLPRQRVKTRIRELVAADPAGVLPAMRTAVAAATADTYT